MSTTALLLVLVAALCHAIWNIAAKRVTGGGYAFVWWYDVWSAIVWVPVGLIALALAGWPWSWGLLFGPLISALVHIGYTLALQTGYDRADLGVVYPVARGTGPVLTMLVALFGLGERPGWSAVLGGLVVVAGIVVVAGGGGGAHRRPVSAGLAWGGLTGAAIATYTLWDDHAMTALRLLPLPYFALTCAWQVALMTPGLRRHTPDGLLPVLRRNRVEVAVVALLSPLAYVLVLEAMRTTPVSLVAPARESSIIVGALFGWWLFREPNPVRKIIGAVLVVLGIVLIV